MSAPIPSTPAVCVARGVCVNHACLGDMLGGCAFFVVTDNDIRRNIALHPQELCHQCGHAWFQHQATKAETDTHPKNWTRGGCPATACGGFFGLEGRESWSYTTLSHLSYSADYAAAPPQFATTHPALATILPPLGAPRLQAAAPQTLHPSLPLAPPVGAFDTVRGHDQGTSSDRRNAAIVRHRIDNVPGTNRQPNVSRPRNTMVTSRPPVLTPSGAVPVLQLQPHGASGSSSSSHPSSSSQSVLNVQEFAVCFFPFVHPSIKRKGKSIGKYPHSSWAFSTQEYKDIFKSLMQWDLVFTVKLSKTGSVFRSLGEQVDIFNKTHAPYDTFNEIKYTHANLVGKKPNLAHIPCPVGDHLIQLPLLRLAPRFGDLEGPLDNHTAHIGNAPGLQEFADIPRPSPTPPGSPASPPIPRVFVDSRAALEPTPGQLPRRPSRAEVDAMLERASRASTPSPTSPFAPWLRSSTLSVPEPPPLLLPEPMEVSSVDVELSVVPAPARSPVPVPASVPQPGPSLDSPPRRQRSARMTAYRVPGGARRRSGRRSAESNAATNANGGNEGSSSARPSIAEGSSGSGAGEGRSTDRGNRRARTDVASPETIATQPPTSRRRIDNGEPEQPASEVPPATRVSGAPPTPTPVAPVSAWVCCDPLGEVKKAELTAWGDRVIAALPPPSSPTDDALPHPHIKAKDAKQAAEVLVFLVNWLFRRGIPSCGPITKDDRRDFAADLSYKFPDDADIECRLVPLAEILRHSRRLHMEVSTALGDSPIRAVLRHAVQHIVKQDQYWQSRGRYHTIRWWLNRPRRAERDSALQTAGFISLLHFLILETGPDPISPYLIEHMLMGRERTCRIDKYFMRCIDAGLIGALAVWENFDTAKPLPQSMNDPLYQLLIAADVDPVHFGTSLLSRGDVETIERALVSQLTLGAPSVADQRDLTAFMLGFCSCHEQFGALMATFRGHERDYIAAMCNQRLEDVGLLFARIDWESGVDEDNVDLTMLPSAEEMAASSDTMDGAAPELLPDCVWDSIHEYDFELAFRHYMVQRGHPDSPIIREMVGQSFEEQAGDPLLRARLFLTMMSGSDLVPQDEHWSIKMKFEHKGDRYPPPVPEGEVAPTPAAIDVRACFYDCTITVDEGLRNLLTAGYPWEVFQSWFHAALLDSDGAFNQMPKTHWTPWNANGYKTYCWCTRKMELELLYARDVGGWLTPSQFETLFPDAGVQADGERMPSEYDRAGSEARTEDHPDAAPSPPPPWEIGWLLGYDSDDDSHWRHRALVDFDDYEPEWPTPILLSLEEGARAAAHGEWPSEDDDLLQAAVDEYLRDLEASLPDGVTVDMLQ
ncbi:hypothetical protein OH76DRAFT_1421217 [Lentinus brumalis]|uniref:Uncharacterized protein n=1 Tax=Lentinus brumalis TaxID=2498619 RepID=A0A371CWT6_9APHY|nr:hypothetical protein OH76DRAFT_1421217 [Polyporus brumalis]